jgi:hypothetical protein
MKEGFFAKVDENNYRGPFLKLSEARDEARIISPDTQIYHGFIKYKDGKIIDKNLSLIQKFKK